MTQKEKQIPFLQLFITFFTWCILGFLTFLHIADINLKNEVQKIHNSWEDVKISQLEEELDMRDFWLTYEILKKNFYPKDDIDPELLVEGATKGLVDALDDIHSEFMTFEEQEVFNAELSGDFEGIGAIVDTTNFWVLIDRVLKGSPASKYWIMQGDIILQADGVELWGMDLVEAISLIKWPAGSSVELTILREGENDFLVKDVVREKITIPSVEAEIIDNIGYIQLNIFGENTADEFYRELENMQDSIDGLLIDLRGNGGWYLDSAVEILSKFVPEDETLVRIRGNSMFLNQVYFSYGDPKLFTKPIVVLVDENSASASEILAWALRDYEKAIIVGKKSYGKGSVQHPFDLESGGFVKLTVSRWYTPNDVNIDKEGIYPDVEVSFSIPAFQESEQDTQFDKAKEVLQNFIETQNYNAVKDLYASETE